MLFEVTGRIQLSEAGVTRSFRKADGEAFPKLTAVARTRPVNGVAASAGEVVPVKDDGSFTSLATAVLAKGTWQLSMRVTVKWRGGELHADAVASSSDLACFAPLLEQHENARPSSQSRFEFLSAVRKMYQPSPDSSLAGLFPGKKRFWIKPPASSHCLRRVPSGARSTASTIRAKRA